MSGDTYEVEISKTWNPLDGSGVRTIYEITGLLLFFFGAFGVTGLIPRDCWDKTFNR
jgi:hypothetical protein